LSAFKGTWKSYCTTNAQLQKTIYSMQLSPHAFLTGTNRHMKSVWKRNL
jgi:hypothetical protein